MQMVGQHNHSDKPKGMLTPNSPYHLSQDVNFLHQQIARPVSRVYREKIGATRRL